jgi:sugar porter (SP) family MFS transporter
MNKKPATFNYSYILSLSLVTAMGGLLFGYDISVITGTIPFIEHYFGLNGAMKGWIVSSAYLGCIAGVVIAGRFGDMYGRKPVLLASAILFAVGSLGCAISERILTFVVYRIIGGVAVGGASVLSPVYIAEISPSQKRGRLVSLNQLAIVIGISLAYFVDYWLIDIGTNNWRWMLLSEALPAALFFVLLIFIPESPRYLIKKGKIIEATHVMEQIGGQSYAVNEIKEIKLSFQNVAQKVGLKDIIQPGIRSVLFLGIFLAVFQQWCGINVIFFYAPDIFRQTHVSVDTALFQATLIGLINLFFTLIAMKYVDTIGRKKLLLIGSIGMFLCYSLLGYFFLINKLQGLHILGILLLTIAFFSSTLGPVVWVIISEIYPNRIRGVATAISTLFLWMACYILTLTFPILMDKIKGAYTFWLYAFICLAGSIVVYYKLPETKGLSLEEIEKKIIN